MSEFPADFVRSSILRTPLRCTDKDSWHGHVPFAFWCIETLRPRVLVELGSHKGDSYCAFCQAVDACSSDTRCYAVDTWKGDPHAGFYGEEVYEELRQYHDPRYGRFSSLVRSTFDEALPRFRDGSIDLLHIDGAHGYEEVRHDFDSWLPKISGRGVVLVHDIEVREADFGVRRFWKEVEPIYPSFSFLHSNGLGVLAVGASPPEALRRLTSLDGETTENVRHLFGRLGDAVHLQSAQQFLARQRVRAAELEASQCDLESQRRGLEASLRQMEAFVAERERQLASLLAERERQLASLLAAQEALFRSTSWKVSAPVRFAGRLLRRLHGDPERDGADAMVERGATAGEPPPDTTQGPAPEGGHVTGQEAEPVAPPPDVSPGAPVDVTAPGEASAAATDATSGASAAGAPAETFVHALLSDEGWNLAFRKSERPEVSIVVLTLNRVEYTYECLESLLAHADAAYELIVVDNGSTDGTRELLSRLRNVTVLRNEVNLGFGPACNQGASRARGEHLLFLNNDATLVPGSLWALLQTVKADPRCGAVGGRLVWPNGRLQEAGGILWDDGTAEAYGRGADPNAPEFSYLREVDFCSGALLLVRRQLFEKLGGFDEQFAPAYYEDVDLCFGIRRLGLRVLYQPGAIARHREYGSSSSGQASALMQRNQGRFAEKWQDDLRRQHRRSPGRHLRSRERVTRPRLLVVDDRIPTSDAGSGYPRAHALLRLLRKHEYPVTLFPSYDATPYQPWLRELQRQGVEVVCDGRPFAEFALARSGLYDVVLVSRPHNFAAVREELTRWLSRAVVIYDAEALFFVREEIKTVLSDGAPLEEVMRRQRQELDVLRFAHLVMAVSEREKRLLEQAAPDFRGQIVVWGHPVEARPGVRSFHERRDLLFVGSFFAPRSPNPDAVSFLVKEVFPLIRRQIDCRLRVVGYGASEAVGQWRSDHVEVVGYAEDLTPYYDGHRVFVVPHRYSGGIPLKLCEAMARGLPAVVSDLTALQLGVEDGQEVLTGRTAEELAAQVVRLYSDEALWHELQANALEFIRRNHDPETLGQALDDIVAGALAAGPTTAG